MGEISIVRSRHEKLQSELSLLRQKEMEKERKWKEEVERLKKENEIERNNLRVQGVFERHGNETQGSRRGWWPQGSAMKSTSIPGRRGMNESPRTHLDEVHQMTPSKNGKGVNPRSFYSNSREGGKKRKAGDAGVCGSPSNKSPTVSRTFNDEGAASSPARAKDLGLSSKKSKVEHFPGFENSFAAPSKSNRKSTASREKRDDHDTAGETVQTEKDDGMDLDQDQVGVDHGNQTLEDRTDDQVQARGNSPRLLSPQPQDRDQDSTLPAALLSSKSTCSDPHRWYLYAITELQRRRSYFVAQILGHTTTPHTPANNLTGSRYLPKPHSSIPKVGAGMEVSSANITTGFSQSDFPKNLPTSTFIKPSSTSVPNSDDSFFISRSPNTLSRILSLQLPSSCPTILHSRLSRGKNDLLTLLSSGSTSDGVDRFKSLISRAEMFIEESKKGILTKEKDLENKRAQDSLFWETDEDINEGLLELTREFAGIVRTLLGLLLRVGLVS